MHVRTLIKIEFAAFLPFFSLEVKSCRFKKEYRYVFLSLIRADLTVLKKKGKRGGEIVKTTVKNTMMTTTMMERSEKGEKQDYSIYMELSTRAPGDPALSLSIFSSFFFKKNVRHYSIHCI